MIDELSVGQTGLIVPGYVYPIAHGKAAVKQTSAEYWRSISPWRPIIDNIHKNGSAIIFQICHGGAVCPPSELQGHTPIGISAWPPGSRAMTEEELIETVFSFGAAAYKLKLAGADGVQIHAAHGYLISASLSPLLNRRRDRWGGTFEGRLRLLRETAARIREQCGEDFIVGVKINGSDCAPGGVTPELSGAYLHEVAPLLDFAEISCGIGPKSWSIRSRIDEDLYRAKLPKVADAVIETAYAKSGAVPYAEGYNLDAAKVIHAMAPKLKLAVVGGMRSVKAMEAAVESGVADIVSLSRPFLKQPHLVRDLRAGRITDIVCSSCGMCTFYRDEGIRCHNW
jgi:2,4-dienoyl-CoA reductase-like NADH-dependent reductase (Old Yellow Enzyme family)